LFLFRHKGHPAKGHSIPETTFQAIVPLGAKVEPIETGKPPINPKVVPAVEKKNQP